MNMQFLIVTGMSGSGKSGAVDALEDIGFYCVDNMPPILISKFVDICMQSGGQLDKIAIVTDIRGGDMFLELGKSLESLKQQGIEASILFLDASDEVLCKRYKETRRKHPLDEKAHGSISRAIAFEREVLTTVREAANYYIDTTDMTIGQLKENIKTTFLDNASDSMLVKVMSFGFKYGYCRDADLVFDVRCLPNPYYIPELKEHTGLESCVSDYVLSFEQSQKLLEKLTDLIDFLIPLYIHEGKCQLVIAFGCTGGKHRSVTFAEAMFRHLTEKGIKARICHKDITKDR